MIDTGCDVCLIKSSVAQRLGLIVNPTSKELTVYGNLKSNVVCGVTTAKLKIDQVKEWVELWVVADSAQSYDLLIGRTFTDGENITFIKTNSEVVFDYNLELPFSKEDYCVTKSSIISASKQQCLKANQVSVVQSRIGDEEIEVLVTNYSSGDKILDKGVKIGKIRNNVNLQCINEEVPMEITDSIVQCGSVISALDKVHLIELINQYRCCFALNMGELGCTNLLTMEIEDNNQPVITRPYKTSLTEKAKIDKIVKEWKALGIVTETNSSYASPVLLVTKKDGEPRLVIDYRKLNQQTVKKTFPIANIDDQLQGLTEANMFCVLDLASGYLQVPLSEQAKQKSAFITPTETGQFELLYLNFFYNFVY